MSSESEVDEHVDNEHDDNEHADESVRSSDEVGSDCSIVSASSVAAVAAAAAPFDSMDVDCANDLIRCSLTAGGTVVMWLRSFIGNSSRSIHFAATRRQSLRLFANTVGIGASIL